MQYLWSFLFCGLVCAIGQFIYNSTKLTAGHITSLFVTAGGLLEVFGIYDKIVAFVGAGASLPIVSFGHSLTHAVFEGINKGGYIEGMSNLFANVGAGVGGAVLLACLVAIIFRAQT